MTQAQLAASINRTGKFISEVETGRARLSDSDTSKLASALGVTVEKLLQADPDELEQQVEDLPRRIRESQPSGMVLFTFPQLIDYLDRAGWLRNCRMWSLAWEPFPEEENIALVEQLGELVSTKGLKLCYVFPRKRLTAVGEPAGGARQGTAEVLPPPLIDALRCSARLRDRSSAAPDTVVGYALRDDFPFFSPLQSYLWIDTADTSWSEVMPLLYGRSETRTHENTNTSVPFWYHLPRARGSRMVINLSQCVKAIDQQPIGA
jgi:transcriptional regulator with XRE-family HTH domain